MADDDQVERTLVQLPSCHVFKIPPRRTAEKYRASEWKDKVWHGKLKIVQKGREAAVMLVDADNQLFAVCPIQEGSIETVADSSRYFVLRIQNAQGRHAFIGLAFNDRNHAFDFNVALQEFQKDVEREARIEQGEGILSSEPSRDFAIPAGEKISVSLKSTGGSSRRAKKGSGGGGSSGGILAPPPSDTPSRRTGAARSQAMDTRSATDDNFHDLSAATPSSSHSGNDLFELSAPAAPSSSPLDLFGGPSYTSATINAPVKSTGSLLDPFGASPATFTPQVTATPTSSALSDLSGFGAGPFTSQPARPMAPLTAQNPAFMAGGFAGYGGMAAPGMPTASAPGYGASAPGYGVPVPAYGAPAPNAFSSFGTVGMAPSVPQPQMQGRPPAAASKDPLDFLS